MPDARPLMPVPYVWKMGIARKCPCPILSDVALPMPARPPFFLPVPTLMQTIVYRSQLFDWEWESILYVLVAK